MTGVSWRPPRTVWLGQRCAGRSLGGGGGGRALGVPAGRWGGEAERLGGGGARSRSRIAGSGGRASLRPAATGRVDGGGPMKTNEGPGVNIPTCATHRLENENASVQVLLF